MSELPFLWSLADSKYVQVGRQVPADQMERFGNQFVAVNIFGTDSAQCDLCGNHSVAYGLCVDELRYSHLQNETLKCVYPFVFVEEQCKCADGFLLNNETCLNLADAVTNLTNLINNNLQSGSQIQQHLADNITQLDQRILSYASNISSTVAQLASNLVTSQKNICCQDFRVLRKFGPC
ncbi:Hypothetical_protein [Hexamita inflata]|uniref:Hypothetical_protein n=1 Tax=Hexamita inflata TaxID=28002 RepID=A0AA86P5E9_9EUKA|nr:Hypothetical protein HINF_LOCUS20014 [Hexamita inflata]